MLHSPRPASAANEVSAQSRQEQAGGRLGAEQANVDAGVRQRQRAAPDRYRDLRVLVVDVNESVIADRGRGKSFEGKTHLLPRRSGGAYNLVEPRQIGRVELAHLVKVCAAVDGGGGQACDGADRGNRHRRTADKRQQRCCHQRDENHDPARRPGLGSFPKRRMPGVLKEKLA